MRQIALGISLAVLLAACGGGAGSQAGADEPAASGEQRATALADATASWVFAAHENQTFDVGGAVQTVRYGAGGSWITKSASGSVPCTNLFFGGDPAYSVMKRCELLSSAGAGSGTWTWMANERGGFNVSGTQTVRYGLGSSWVTRTVSGYVACTNEFFGSDPAYAQMKRCEMLSAAGAGSGGSWAWLANEGSSFNVSGTQTVRYGTDSRWVERAVSGSGACTNQFFGSDPAVTLMKRCEVSSNGAAAPAPAPTPAPAPAPAPAPVLATTTLLASGHSLTVRGIWVSMEAVASSLGTPLQWNQQIVNGSPMRVRTRGNWLDDPAFSGYRLGENRSGNNMDVVSELLSPRTVSRRYDTLVLTERHDIVNTLMWEDTVRYTRHFHDRLIAGNAGARTQLYHSWLPVSNKHDPNAWLQFERTAARAWQCTAARVNMSLAAVGRGDRVAYLPAALALADLVEQAAVHGAVPGLSGGGVGATMDRLFTDGVHLTPLGEYYMGLVAYSAVYRRSPVGGWAPSGVSAQTAAALQNLAWQSTSNHLAASASAPSMGQCQAAMRDQVCGAYANYAGNPGIGPGCSALFSEASARNPFHYDAAADAAYWFPAPR